MLREQILLGVAVLGDGGGQDHPVTGAAFSHNGSGTGDLLIGEPDLQVALHHLTAGQHAAPDTVPQDLHAAFAAGAVAAADQIQRITGVGANLGQQAALCFIGDILADKMDSIHRLFLLTERLFAEIAGFAFHPFLFQQYLDTKTNLIFSVLLPYTKSHLHNRH